MKVPEHLKQWMIEQVLKKGFKALSQHQQVPTSVLRHSMNMSAELLKVERHVLIRACRLGNCPAEQFNATTTRASGQVILHVHGGAFFLGGLNSHRALASQLASLTGATVYTIDYPLSPEQVYPHAMLAVKNAVMELILQGYDAKDIIISGDSCGGNLALAAVLALRDAGQPLPAGMILMSPFLDLTLSGDSIRLNKTLDAMLNTEFLQRGIHYYIGQYEASHPLVSPLFADLSGLPPTLVQVGSKEILLDDSKRFKDLAHAAGSPVSLNIYPGMWHVFQLFSQWSAPAKQSLEEIAGFVAQLKTQ